MLGVAIKVSAITANDGFGFDKKALNGWLGHFVENRSREAQEDESSGLSLKWLSSQVASIYSRKKRIDIPLKKK